jgi:hypothetical protein
MKEKRWTNKEVDSTVYMVVFLCAFIGFIAALVFYKDFRESEIAGHIMLLFSSTLGSMAIYFFGNKQHHQNGDPQQER